VILLALSFLTPYFYYIPRATLAAVLISAIMTMFDYQIFPKLWRCNKFDFFLTLTTVIIGVCYGVEVGIIAGGLLNLLILLKVWTRPRVTTEIRMDHQGNDYIYVRPEVGLFYAATDHLTTKIIQAYNSTKGLPIVLDCSGIIQVDYAACQVSTVKSNTATGALYRHVCCRRSAISWTLSTKRANASRCSTSNLESSRS
jgi:sodium-independent sulfate anion transporter 11